MSALCATRDPELLARTFAFMVTDEVKMQDLAYFFSGLSSNPMAKRNLWAAFKANYPEISKKFKGEFFLFLPVSDLLFSFFDCLLTSLLVHLQVTSRLAPSSNSPSLDSRLRKTPRTSKSSLLSTIVPSSANRWDRDSSRFEARRRGLRGTSRTFTTGWRRTDSWLEFRA